MCNLKDVLSVEVVHGYKIAILRNDKYYSPTTGIEYKVGPVEIPDKQVNTINFILDDLLDEDSPAYSSSMVGRTCVILDCIEVKNRYDEWKKSFSGDGELILLKMSITQDLMFGQYGRSNVVGGRYIQQLTPAEYEII